MIGGIIATHAGLAAGLKEAIEMIAGKQEYLAVVSLQEGDGLDTLMSDMQTVMQSMKDMDVMVFTDLFGATPCNAASFLCTQMDCFVIAGVNLPLLLTFITKRETATIEEMKAALLETSKQDYRWIERRDVL